MDTPRCRPPSRWRRLRRRLGLLALGALLAPASRAELLLDAAPTADGAWVTVGARGTVRRSADGGMTWQSITAVPYTTYTAVAFAPQSPDRGWAAGHGGIILGTTDAGRTWSIAYRAEETDTSFLDVLALSADHVLAVGAFGLCLESTDAGATWTPRVLLDEDMHLNRLSQAGDGTLYLAGEAGTLLRSTDRGLSWSSIATDYEGSFYGVLPLEGAVVLAYGQRGTVFRSIDRGDNWTAIPTDSTALLQTGLRLPDGTILLAGQARTLLISRDEGLTFTAAPAPPAAAIAELSATANPPRVLAFGEADVVLLPPP